VTAATLPFTGIDLPVAVLAALALLTLGGASLALARRRAKIE
jgi:LPXTG-motif cell wall-anchored protein